mmetsp:Transcript_4373/g.12629  ORF Transcript_4373/g.12629 Transcript_4373/m.12629 type:complete len:207 (-) Transcript_4373:2018-2638(-)
MSSGKSESRICSTTPQSRSPTKPWKRNSSTSQKDIFAKSPAAASTTSSDIAKPTVITSHGTANVATSSIMAFMVPSIGPSGWIKGIMTRRQRPHSSGAMEPHAIISCVMVNVSISMTWLMYKTQKTPSTSMKTSTTMNSNVVFSWARNLKASVLYRSKMNCKVSTRLPRMKKLKRVTVIVLSFECWKWSATSTGTPHQLGKITWMT